jgi:hypothetical protein
MLSLEKWGRAPALTALLVAACHGSNLDSSQTAGDLGNGAFRYLCVDRDAVCPSGGDAKTFPERIGTTGVFDVKFDAFGTNSAVGFDIVAATADVVTEENNLFLAKAPGTVALLAKRTSDSRVLDFTHIQVVDITKIRFEGTKGESPSVVWNTGTRQTLRAVPLDKEGAVLAGGMQYEWATSDATVARLDLANPAAQMELMPLKAGSLTLSVTASGRTDTLAVTVQGTAIQLDGGRGGQGGQGGGGAGGADAATPSELDATAPTSAGGAHPADAGPRDAGADGGQP